METNIEKKDIENQTIKKVKKAPVILIIMSGLSFIPAIGVVFGLISIVISLFNFKRFKLLFILGLAGFVTLVSNFKRYCDLSEKEDI
jgi:predicted PurR-regulated permease PerM